MTQGSMWSSVVWIDSVDTWEKRRVARGRGAPKGFMEGGNPCWTTRTEGLERMAL
jgi:hypothetical protein